VEPENNVWRSVWKDFQLEKTSAAHGSEQRVDAFRSLERERDVVAAGAGVSTLRLSLSYIEEQQTYDF